ncbi:hypothetical protein MMC26_007322 [Xylographa opegraphella]|nr:hypothetical protein [Xylographa opegraphella]
MATLNLSTNGPSISKSYQSIVNSPPPSGNTAQSPTFGQWAVFSVSAPLVNAFQQDAGGGGKESILKVQSTGEGELVDLIEDFSDGRVQFAFVKVKDRNTSLPKYVLIGWCGEGVPERTKGYFTSHLAAVEKVLHGYHVQVIARSDRDLTPEDIVQKVSDGSGSKYSAGYDNTVPTNPPAAVASKPAIKPIRSGGGSSAFNPLGSTGSRFSIPQNEIVDDDGWGHDAPQVTRTLLEKVASAYQPTKVNMHELNLQTPESSSIDYRKDTTDRTDVIKGGYQPVGKVDIAALRRQAQESVSRQDDRPNVVKGSYEPVGKVDIAAIRAKAQPPLETAKSSSGKISPALTGTSARSSEPEDAKPLSERSLPVSSSERLMSLPRPKVANKYGSNVSSFVGTKASTPGIYGVESKLSPDSPPVGASRTFADEGGKTPAQIWAEKKARERGSSATSEQPTSVGFGMTTSPMASHNSGSGEWKSGYSGKSWAAVQITKTGQSSTGVERQRTDDDETMEPGFPHSSAGGIGALRERFTGAAPMGAAVPASEKSVPSPPPLDSPSKPNGHHETPIPSHSTRPSHIAREQESERPMMPSPPLQPPRFHTPPTPVAEEREEEPSSPIRVAMPVPRGAAAEVEAAPDEQFSPPPAMPTRSLAQVVSREIDNDEKPSGYDAARGASHAAAAASFGHEALAKPIHTSQHSGKRAVAQYDYEKAEDNELELKEGEQVTNIEMVDDDWWMGENARGETGLFPSNYVELVQDDSNLEHAATLKSTKISPSAAANTNHPVLGPIATALYDYEAAEDNELSFPENAKITSLEFPDEDWWSGEYGGRSGLFPANYVQLDE